MFVVESEDVLGGEPSLEDPRISVLQITDRVLTHDRSPDHIAEQLDVSVAEVHQALPSSYRNVDEMDEIRERHREFEAELEQAATPER